MWILLGAVAVALVVGHVLLYQGKPYWSWVLPGAAAVIAWPLTVGIGSPVAYGVIAGLFAALAIVFGVPAVRKNVVTRAVWPIMDKLLPKMSDTERAALEAGTVWFDGELFTGDPDWDELLDYKVQPLTDEEQAFLDNQVERVCEMLTEWQVIQDGDLPDEVWDYIRKEKFFGMIVPKEYGGLGFSAALHAAVVTKLGSRSVTAAVTVMVPNSLGPAELLLHYGTQEQKDYYLPRLADGTELPCFGLTEPEAGSDAGAASSAAVVCKGEWEGKEVLGMRLNFEKRYITLGPVSTLIGLAFRLKDPDGLLGGEKDLGITCALIPADTPGVEIGDRHAPGLPFQNGPLYGKDVFLPLDQIIGGQKMAGQGWRMLMDCLSAGRAISLPSMSLGGAQMSSRVISAYGLIREQFKTPIAFFEGVEERISRIAGFTYWMEAMRRLTVGAVDNGEKPSVLSAISKYHSTEGMRTVVNDAMDVQAGAAICRGPRNILAPAYATLPVGITVEGANILTRSMIIFGQGAIRGHPYALKEMESHAAGDLTAFDKAFFGHVGFVFTNAFRGFWSGLTGMGPRPAKAKGPMGRHFATLTQMSAAFGFVSDVAMGTLGGKLKFMEKISARLGDVLSHMYIASATLKRFYDEGALDRDRPFAEWAVQHHLYAGQEALRGVLDNYPIRPIAMLVKPIVFPRGARLRPPSDALGAEVSKALLFNKEAREALTSGVFIPKPDEQGLGYLEAALVTVRAAAKVEKKVRKAIKEKKLPKGSVMSVADKALEAGIIDPDERKKLDEAQAARREVIEVDSFSQEEYKEHIV